MGLDDAHARYLTEHGFGRLATVAPDGRPQNKPVGYRYNAELGTIDITGLNMKTSAKYRNVGVNPNVAFVIDDLTGQGPSGMRFLEVRGRAERVAVGHTTAARPSTVHVIRIHPRRIRRPGPATDGRSPVRSA